MVSGTPPGHDPRAGPRRRPPPAPAAGDDRGGPRPRDADHGRAGGSRALHRRDRTPDGHPPPGALRLLSLQARALPRAVRPPPPPPPAGHGGDVRRPPTPARNPT